MTNELKQLESEVEVKVKVKLKLEELEGRMIYASTQSLLWGS